MAIAALSSGVTGLNAAERALGNSAHAIANIGTQGFQPSQARFQENAPAGSGVWYFLQGQQLLAVDAPSATNLATETGKLAALQGPVRPVGQGDPGRRPESGHPIDTNLYRV